MISLKRSEKVDYDMDLKWISRWSQFRKVRVTKPGSKSLKTARNAKMGTLPLLAN